MLLPVVLYEYPYLWANGVMLSNNYTKSVHFHRVKVSIDYHLWSYHLRKLCCNSRFLSHRF